MRTIRNILIILLACIGITFAQDWGFGYIGGVKEFTVETSGIYRLEVWGAQGGSAFDGDGSSGTSGGGYAAGNITLTKGQKLYVAVGGGGPSANQGGPDSGESVGSGGYNGGGAGWHKFSGSGHRQAAGGGGGATHIATTNRGVLSNYYYYQSEVLIVAGGSAGARLARYDTDRFSVLGAGGAGGTGGGNAFGQGAGARTGDDWANSGGGGGWSGGSQNNGGTNYLSSSLSSTTSQSDKQAGNGYAKITLVQEIKYNLDLNSILNGTQIYSLGDAATANVYINGNLVCSNCTDWCQDYGSGTTYKIDITPKSNYSVVSGGTCQGTINSSSVGCNPEIKQKFTVTINVNNGYSTIRDTKLWSDIYRLPTAPDITGYTFQHYRRTV